MRSVIDEAVDILRGLGAPALAESDRRTGLTAAIVVGVGGGTIVDVSFWNPDTGGWVATAPTVSVGKTIGVRVNCSNPTGSSLTMRVDAEIIAPTGSVTKATGTEFTVSAGAKVAYEHKWSGSMAGTWKVNVILYSGVSLIDEYLARIAAATTRAELDSIRSGFEADYSAGRMTYAQYTTLYNAYAAKYAYV